MKPDALMRGKMKFGNAIGAGQSLNLKNATTHFAVKIALNPTQPEPNNRKTNMNTKTPKIITKHCNYLRQAEAYQQRLYGKYNSVQLVNFPRFNTAGYYTWRVS